MYLDLFKPCKINKSALKTILKVIYQKGKDKEERIISWIEKKIGKLTKQGKIVKVQTNKKKIEIIIIIKVFKIET